MSADDIANVAAERNAQPSFWWCVQTAGSSFARRGLGFRLFSMLFAEDKRFVYLGGGLL